MNTARMINTNRFWQQRQTFDRACEMKHEIDTKGTPQVGGSTETL
jgi:cytochrome c5